jgi:uncharacterized protein YjbI with pentapeptide repeats
MHAHEILRPSAAGEANFNGAPLSEANLVRVSLIAEKVDGEKLSGENLDRTTTSDNTMLLVPIYFFVFTGSLIFLRLSKSYRAARNQITTLKRLNQVPCRNCRFYTGNHYLLCTVHPSTVLKEEAINCPDYCPKNGKLHY